MRLWQGKDEEVFCHLNLPHLEPLRALRFPRIPDSQPPSLL